MRPRRHWKGVPTSPKPQPPHLKTQVPRRLDMDVKMPNTEYPGPDIQMAGKIVRADCAGRCETFGEGKAATK